MLKIPSPEAIREIELKTLERQSISALDLMERAAQRCCEWILRQHPTVEALTFFCGTGNNGGDGLAMARLCREKGISVQVIAVGNPDESTLERLANLKRLRATEVPITTVRQAADCPKVPIREGVVVDCLFGLGLNRPVRGYLGEVIDRINASAVEVVSIDMPSGLLADRPTPGGAKVVHADQVLSFQFPKLAFLLPDCAAYVKHWYLIDIGLELVSSGEAVARGAYYISRSAISDLYRPREKFSHKGTYGHSLLIGGSYGKMGAILLSILACMRTGSGLTSAYIPRAGYDVVQTRAPEAMCVVDKGEAYLLDLDFALRPAAVGIGPGMGMHREAAHVLHKLFKRLDGPVVIDADAINVLAQHPALLSQLPEHTILTPHHLEFQRLAGSWSDDFERLERLRAFARAHRCVLVCKGAHTVVVNPQGALFFNPTGNPGMAKGGSGDVLTGMLCSLLAQGYNALQATVMGVYLHGMAADIALRHQSQESVLATDIIAAIGRAFKCIAKGTLSGEPT